MNRKMTRWIGGVFWSLILVLVIWFVAMERSDFASGFLRSWSTQSHTIFVQDPTGWLRKGDAVFGPVETTEDRLKWRQIGYVDSIESGTSIRLFQTIAATDQSVWEVHRSTGRLEDVLQTLLPKHKQELLLARLQQAMDQHADAITEMLTPIILQSLRQSAPMIENALEDSLARHQDELEALADRYRGELIDQRIVPLMKEEVLPIVQRYGREPAEDIGREIWQKASIWRFTWRAIYDKSPLPERDMVKEEWDRFVDAEVVPIVEDHLDELAVAVEAMLRDLGKNERLRGELGEIAGEISGDPEVRNLVQTILRESVLENEPLREEWMTIWSSPEAKASLRAAGKRIEPVLRRIGDEVMGTREGGIEPGFARVLRNQILGKDRSWVTVSTAGARSVDFGQGGQSKNPNHVDTIQLRAAAEFMPYPVVHLAVPRNSIPPKN